MCWNTGRICALVCALDVSTPLDDPWLAFPKSVVLGSTAMLALIIAVLGGVAIMSFDALVHNEFDTGRTLATIKLSHLDRLRLCGQ